MRRAVMAVLCWCCLTGCFSYVPAGVGEVAPEQKVRVRLSPNETARLQEFVNPESRTVTGTVVEQGADSLLLLVPAHTELRGARVETLYQRIQVGKNGILETEIRELDRGKTYLVGGAVVAAALAVTIQQLHGGGGSEVTPPGGGPNDAVIPLFALSLPFRMLGLIGR